jgi:hypothetical protein
MRIVKLKTNGMFDGHLTSPTEWADATPVEFFNGHFIRPPSHMVLPDASGGAGKRVEVRVDRDGHLLLAFDDEQA